MSLLVPLLTLLMSSGSPSQAALSFDRAERSSVFFKDTTGDKSESKKLSLDWFDLKHLGQISADGDSEAVYFLFSAKPCENCSTEAAMIAVRTDQGVIATFTYPGKILDMKTKELLHDSRFFLGKCFPGLGEAFVVYQHDKVGKKRPRLSSSVYYAEAKPLYLREKLLEKGRHPISWTLNAVKKKQCLEIGGRNRIQAKVELAPPKAQSEKDEEELDDNDPAEAQVDSPAPIKNTSPAGTQ